jgi:hypothetical protein
VIGIALLLLFAAAQVGVIFLTAWLAWRYFKLVSGLWKPLLMFVSWLAWCVLTLAGYGALGGDGGFMDGMGMMLALCLSALVSTAVYCVIWGIAPLFAEPELG